MKNENVWQSFMDSLTEDLLQRELNNFIKYLGFEGFEKSDITGFYETLSFMALMIGEYLYQLFMKQIELLNVDML